MPNQNELKKLNSIEKIGESMISINPSLLAHYDCALLCVNDVECPRFSTQEIAEELGISLSLTEVSHNKNPLQQCFEYILFTFQNPFIEINVELNGQQKTAYLFYHSHPEKLKIRAITLAYLFNQSTLMIYPKGNNTQTDVYKICDGQTFCYQQKIKQRKSLEKSLGTLCSGQAISLFSLKLKERDDFIRSSIWTKMCFSQKGDNIDKNLQKIFEQAVFL